MTATAVPSGDRPALESRPDEALTPVRRGFKPPPWLRRLGSWSLNAYAAFVILYLLLPVAYTFAFSFNNAGRTNLVWNSFTLDNWLNPCGAPQVCPSVVNSITVALIVTLVSTFLGTLIAFSLVRYRFRGRSTTNLLIFLPMATPEVVLG